MTECSEQSKCCTKCNVVKSLTEFSKSSRSKSGFLSQCKPCSREYQKYLRTIKAEKYKETRQKNYQKNIEKMRAEKRQYYKNHKEEKSLYDIEYRKQNKSKIAAYKKEWEKSKRHETAFKITRNLRRRIHHALMGRNKSDHTLTLLGCSVEFFKDYLEGLWEDGMNWSNYSPSGWHIDHIKPCYTFDLTDPEQQKVCFHYSNQRPLWAKDNLKRSKSLQKYSIDNSHQSHQESET